MRAIHSELPDELLCALYGEQARTHYGDAPWTEVEPRLHAGWYRIRGDCRLDWRAASTKVKREFDAPRTRAGPCSVSPSDGAQRHATRREIGLHR